MVPIFSVRKKSLRNLFAGSYSLIYPPVLPFDCFYLNFPKVVAKVRSSLI